MTIALTLGFKSWIRLRCAASSSRAESFFARMSRAISTAEVKQSSVGMVSAFAVAAARMPKASRRVGCIGVMVASLPVRRAQRKTLGYRGKFVPSRELPHAETILKDMLHSRNQRSAAREKDAVDLRRVDMG